jgi:hypothetical protein
MVSCVVVQCTLRTWVYSLVLSVGMGRKHAFYVDMLFLIVGWDGSKKDFPLSRFLWGMVGGTIPVTVTITPYQPLQDLHQSFH